MTTKITRLGKYHLLERLHAGSIAEVFVAKAAGVEGFERIVALKKILPVMAEDEEFNRLFLDEARISVQLSHANIVHTLEFGKEDDTFFIVMEFVTGKDVRAVLEHFRRSGQPAPIPLAAYVLSKVCEGLDYAHRKKDARGKELNIVHRAVAPQNILLSFDGEVKLIDFGMAKAANRLQKTQAGVLRGAAGYMSPELVKGEAIDHRTDIFAAGVVLYELLTGRKLFQGDSDFSTMELVANANVPPPTGVNPNIPDELEAVLMRALARDPNERYQYASELQEALARFQLAGDSLYTASQLSSFLKTNFDADVKREAAKMERYAATAVAAPSTGASGLKQRRTLTGMPAVSTAGITPTGHEITSPKTRTDLPFDLPSPEEKVDRTVIVSLDPGAPTDGDGLSQSTQIAAMIPGADHPEAARSRSGSNLKAVSLTGMKAVKVTQAPATRNRDSGAGTSDATVLSNGPSGEVTSPGKRPTGAFPKLEITQPRAERPVDPDFDPLETTNPALQFPGKDSPPAAARGTSNGTKRKPVQEVGFGESARTDPSANIPAGAKKAPAPAPVPVVVAKRKGPSRNLLIGGGVGLVAVLALVLALVLGREPANGQGIVVRVTPQDAAKVTVNGRLIPPNRVTRFPPGEYDLVAMAPGYKRHTQRITIFKDDTEAVFDIFLEHEDDPGTTVSGPNTATKPPPPVATQAAPPKGLSARFIAPEVGVEVLVDGRSVGSTPNAVVKDLTLGQTYHYVARKEGYETVEWDFQSPEPGELLIPLTMKEETKQLVVALPVSKPPRGEKRPARATGKLVATTDPAGAELFVDGHPMNSRTPITASKPLELPAGKHKVVFRLAGFESETLTVTIKDGEAVELSGVKVDKENDAF